VISTRDKTRANQSLNAFLRSTRRLSQSVKDVLENFQGRHRNLLETFEARADVMEKRWRRTAFFQGPSPIGSAIS